MKVKPSVPVYTAAVLLAVSTTACLFSEEATAPPKNPANSEPKYVLANLQYSFNHRDEENLQACLGADFVFYFDPTDVGRIAGENYLIPASWGKADLKRAARNIFERAQTLSFSVAWENLGTPGEEVEYVLKENVAAELVVTLEGNVVYRGTGSGDFGFSKEAPETWKLAKWQDGTGPGAEEVSNLGFLLASFYE